MFAMALATLASSPANAQNNVLTEYYGRGVHAYFNHDLISAYDLLTKAIDNGVNDPRPYYFRGLTSAASGNEYEADSDYKAGAELEARGIFGPSISQSLTRIQGSCRTAIEDARLQARLDYYMLRKAKSDARYGDIEAAEPDVLRERPTPRPPLAPPVAARIEDNPFKNDAATGTAKVESPDAMGGEIKDPFADDATAKPDDAAPAGNDPFGGSGDARPEVSDPFGGAAPAADDPFGGADPFGN